MHSDTTYEVWGEHPDRVILSTESRAEVEYMAAQALEAGDAEALACRVFEIPHVDGFVSKPVQKLAEFVPPVMGPSVPEPAIDMTRPITPEAKKRARKGK